MESSQNKRLKLSVSIRIKPDSNGQSSFQQTQDWQKGMLHVYDQGKNQSIGTFTSVIGPKEDQSSVNQKVMQPLINSFMNGVNCTVFVYGQTGSGKTHTLFGPPKFFNQGPNYWGICPVTMMQLFKANGGNSQMSMSAVEVYFDDCYDLLNNKIKIAIAGFGAGVKSKAVDNMANVINKDSNGKWVSPLQSGFQINTGKEKFEAKGQVFKQVNALEEVMEIMKLVEATRTAKSHAINDRSSRSHCLVTLKQVTKNGNKQIENKFMFVDLAGSERIAKTEVENLRASEAKNINTSLSALGRCINALSKSNGGFVPYRDSGLTMLMKESLSGNCQTSLVVTVAENPDFSNETVSSLRFGLNCGKISQSTRQQVTVDIGQNLKQLEYQLVNINHKIQDLEQSGKAGGLDMEQPKTTRDHFLNNFQKLQKVQNQLQDVQMKLMQPNCDKEKIKQRKADLQFEFMNYKGILARQLTTYIWKEPTPAYPRMLKERKALETEISSITGQQFPNRHGEQIYELNFSSLLGDIIMDMDDNQK